MEVADDSVTHSVVDCRSSLPRLNLAPAHADFVFFRFSRLFRFIFLFLLNERTGVSEMEDLSISTICNTAHAFGIT